MFDKKIGEKYVYVYADELALLHTAEDWKKLEEVLSQDIFTLSKYLQSWRLKLNEIKKVASVFHLNNRKAECGIAQKIIIAHRTTKTTCRFGIRADAKALGTAALSPVYFTAEHCAPV